jgi:hypothetical protein
MISQKLKIYFTKQNISLFIFLFVNFIFSIKYLSRLTNYYIVFSVFILIFYFYLWKYLPFLNRKIYSNRLNFFILLLFITSAIYIFNKININTLNVDRWSVITSFWDNFFKGEYVYFAKSNVGNPPGPMPFYFILALPFYLIGELGYFSILGIIAFYLLLKKTKTELHIQTTYLILISGSLFYLWEIVCRSNIFLNGTIVLCTIVYFFNLKIFNLKNTIISGVIIGLVISTRNVYIIPFIIAFLYSLKSNIVSIKQVLLLGLFSVSTFMMTFLPFVWNHFEEFKTMNPFIVQSTFLIPFEYTLLFIGLSFVAGFLCKVVDDVYFYSSLILFISISIYLTYNIVKIGFSDSFFGSSADISYFILCIPFALYHLIKKNSIKI